MPCGLQTELLGELNGEPSLIVEKYAVSLYNTKVKLLDIL